MLKSLGFERFHFILKNIQRRLMTDKRGPNLKIGYFRATAVNIVTFENYEL